jgi:hypothetical protein
MVITNELNKLIPLRWIFNKFRLIIPVKNTLIWQVTRVYDVKDIREKKCYQAQFWSGVVDSVK